jgi:hypothetical protein
MAQRAPQLVVQEDAPGAALCLDVHGRRQGIRRMRERDRPPGDRLENEQQESE